MKVKVSEMQPHVLRYAVALVHGWKFGKVRQLDNDALFFPLSRPDWPTLGTAMFDLRDKCWTANVPPWEEDWGWGGPIIERLIKAGAVLREDNMFRQQCFDSRRGMAYIGDTTLVAAMRCFVASELGDEVEVPEELLT